MKVVERENKRETSGYIVKNSMRLKLWERKAVKLRDKSVLLDT
jgi:hypothetical protein